MLESALIQRHTPAFIPRHNLRRTAPPVAPAPAPARVPRVTRLMVLALRFEELLACGAVEDQAQLAELGHVTRARVTQIMNLLHLAPDIQETLLAWSAGAPGAQRIRERHLRPIVAETDWTRQRRLWRALLAAVPDSAPSQPWGLTRPSPV